MGWKAKQESHKEFELSCGPHQQSQVHWEKMLGYRKNNSRSSALLNWTKIMASNKFNVLEKKCSGASNRCICSHCWSFPVLQIYCLLHTLFYPQWTTTLCLTVIIPQLKLMNIARCDIHVYNHSTWRQRQKGWGNFEDRQIYVVRCHF